MLFLNEERNEHKKIIRGIIFILKSKLLALHTPALMEGTCPKMLRECWCIFFIAEIQRSGD